MNAYFDQLISRKRQNGILIDTNLMLLLTVGTYDVNRLLTFKRTLKYTLDDYSLMMRLLQHFDRRVTTPNILTEVDNLARQLPEKEHEGVAVALSQLVDTFFEIYVPSGTMLKMGPHAEIGLTDCVILNVAKNVLVVTDDFRLSNTLAASGIEALNINHIRDLGIGWA